MESRGQIPFLILRIVTTIAGPWPLDRDLCRLNCELWFVRDHTYIHTWPSLGKYTYIYSDSQCVTSGSWPLVLDLWTLTSVAYDMVRNPGQWPLERDLYRSWHKLWSQTRSWFPCWLMAYPACVSPEMAPSQWCHLPLDAALMPDAVRCRIDAICS